MLEWFVLVLTFAKCKKCLQNAD